MEFNLLNLISGSSVLSSKICAEDTFYTLTLSPELRISRNRLPELSIGELDLVIKLGDFINIQTGLIKHKPGSALFFSNVEFFSYQDILKLLQDGIEAEAQADDLLILKLLGENWHVNALFSPYLLHDNLLETDSIWFPTKGLRTTYQIASYKYKLNNLTWKEQESYKYELDKISYSFESGFSIGPIDTTCFYFNGIDRSYSIIGKISFPVEPWASYDIELIPVHGQIEKIGLTSSIQIDAWRLWIDGVAFKGKTIATLDLYNPGTGWETKVRKVDGIDSTFGLSWNIPIPDGFVAIESRYAWYGDVQTGDTYPALDKAACFLFSGSLFDQTINYAFASIISLSDYSYCLLPSISFPIGSDNNLNITLPLFIGAIDSDFGQYAKQTILKIVAKFQLQ